jgi:alanine-glyoxylate transaminase/serine-glyoxylate transaminase/serine-pyruvate transaminase
MLAMNPDGWFPYTPSTNLLYGLREAIAMLEEEGFANVFARHDRHAEPRAARCAPGASRSSARIPTNTVPRSPAIVMPAGHDADKLREVILANFDMSLGMGLVEGSRAR